MPLAVITPPATEPLTLTEGKLQLGVTGSDDDSLITPLITSARTITERKTRRTLITTQRTLTRPHFPAAAVLLPYPPLQAVDSIEYLPDGSSDYSTLADSRYDVTISDDRCGEIALAYGDSWPSTASHPEAVKITFTAGYGASGSDVDALLLAIVRLQLEDLYDEPDERRAARLADLIATHRNEQQAAYEHV